MLLIHVCVCMCVPVAVGERADDTSQQIADDSNSLAGKLAT